MKRLFAISLIYCFSLPISLSKPIDVIIYSATAWYRHPEIPKLNGFLVRLGAKHNINISVTENPADLKQENLKDYNLLLLNNATNLGENIPKEIQRGIINWFEGGGAIMAMHAGIVQNGTWPELIEIAGCDFDSDSDYMEARFLVDPKAEGDPILAGKKKQFNYTADWLCFNRSVTGLPGVEVLLRLDEKSYTPVRKHPSYVGKKPMGDDHPICWRRQVGKGRYLFTGLGHDVRSIDNEFARNHLIAGMRWVTNSTQVKEKKSK
jgi:type 1 glutamine amidotransferase